MAGFGEILRSEREARNVPIERISDETGIHRDYLEALEKDEFQGLPGRSFGKLYIRAYARMLGLDPQPLIEAYDREWQRTRPVPAHAPDARSGAEGSAGSLVSSWRQSRIAERRRPAKDTDTGGADAQELEALEEEVAAVLDDAATTTTDEVAADDGTADAHIQARETDASTTSGVSETADEPTSPGTGLDADDELGVATTLPDASPQLEPIPDPKRTAEPERTTEPERMPQLDAIAQPDSMEQPGPSLLPEQTLRPERTPQSEPIAPPDSTAQPEAALMPEPTLRPEPTLQPESTPQPESTLQPESTVPPERTPKLEPIALPQPPVVAPPRLRRRATAIVLALSVLAGLSAVGFLLMGRPGTSAPVSSVSPASPSSQRTGSPSLSSAATPSTSGAAVSSLPKRAAPIDPRAGTVPTTHSTGRENVAPAATAVPSSKSRTTEASLSVTESALGQRMVNHRVEGRDERFKEGTVVWFQTRAVGGVSGDTLRHVWIRDGRTEQTIRLRIGGPDWRTVSRKTVMHAGNWSVEARDQEDRVLARADFTCAASSD